MQVPIFYTPNIPTKARYPERPSYSCANFIKDSKYSQEFNGENPHPTNLKPLNKIQFPSRELSFVYNKINFCSRANHLLKNAFSEFQAEFSKLHPNTNIEDFIETVIKKPSNKIGEGKYKIVYDIPQMPNFVVGRFKDKKHKKAPFVKSNFAFEQYNFAQPIASNGNDLILMVKVKGKPLYLPDYTRRRTASFENESSITPTDARIFLSDLRLIADFPMSSYIDYAKQVKCITDQNHRYDYKNPNNVLIDAKSKKFRVVDLRDGQERFSDFKKPINSSIDMICILTDALMQKVYRQNLSAHEIAQMDAATVKIIKKCQQAAEEVGLANFQNCNIFKDILREKECFYERYCDFFERFRRYLYQPNTASRLKAKH